MRRIERVFHAVLFEVLAISLTIVGLAVFTNHEIMKLSGTMIVVATMAMVWNMIFNWVFDQYVPGKKELRSLKTRICHVVLFELGLLFFTVPVIAYILEVSILDALVMDIGMTIFITLYAFVFNLAYDHIRAWVISRKSPTLA